MHKIKVLAILDNLIPSTILTTILPMLRLEKEGFISFQFEYTRTYKEKNIAACDIVILNRNMIYTDLEILEFIKKHDKKLIYDIDDNFFDIPLDTPIGQYHRHPVHLYTIIKMLKASDAVRVYSDIMYKRVAVFTPRVKKYNAYFDFDLIKDLKRGSNKKIRIVFATSRANDELYLIYLPALQKILSMFPDTVEFCNFGNPLQGLEDFKNTITFPYMPNYNSYIHFFYQQGFDIGLAPMPGGVFYNSKTNNKFREYGAMGVAGIYSSTLLYSDSVVDGETGLLVENTCESWYEAIKRLIVDTKLLETIKTNAHNEVKLSYSMESFVDEFRKQLAEIYHAPVNASGRVENILKLKVALLIDNIEHPVTQIRLRPLVALLNYCRIYNKIQDISMIAKTKNKCDVLIYLPDPTKAVDHNQVEWLRSFYKHVIVDGEDTVSTGLPTQDMDIIANVNNLRLYDAQTEILGQTIKMHDNLGAMVELFHSTDSEVVQWALLLEEIRGSGKIIRLPSRLHRMGNLIAKPFKWLNKRLMLVGAYYKKMLARLSFRLRAAYAYACINYFERY